MPWRAVCYSDEFQGAAIDDNSTGKDSTTGVMSMTETTINTLAASDWEALERLVAQVGLPAERVSLLRRRLDGERSRPGSPYTLIIGRPDAGIEQFIARLLGPQAVEALEAAGSRPLVVGPTPESVRPRLGSWPTLMSPASPSGHVLILRTPAAPPADVMAGLGGLGMIDQVVLVSRLLQAMHEREREILAALAPLAATARAVLVWRPGEEPTEADIVEVTAATDRQIQGRGFEGGRDLGVSVMFAGEQANTPGSLTDPSELLRVDEAAVSAGQAGMARAALSDLLNAIYRKAGEATAAAPTGIPPEEHDRLTRELTGYLADLGRETGRVGAKKTNADAAWAQGYVLDAIKGWAAYAGIEGHWLRYVETLRPGTQAALIAEAERAISCLDYRSKPVRAKAIEPAGGGAQRWLLLEAKRAAVGLILGLGAYAGIANLVKLPPVVDIVVGLSSMALGSILGYAVGRWIFPGPNPPVAASPHEEVTDPGSPIGWSQFERRIAGWFADISHAQPTPPAEVCRDLARRLGIALEGEIQP